jgi:rhodanese-related sulfurtransferase
LQRVRDRLITFLDVRPSEEYDAGQVPGAINIPLSELEKYLNKLETTKEVAAYCCGSHCILAFDAVEKSKKRLYCPSHGRRLSSGNLLDYPLNTAELSGPCVHFNETDTLCVY